MGNLFGSIVDIENLKLAFYKAAKGKASRGDVIEYRIRLAKELSSLRRGLLDGDYPLGNYRKFKIFEPKERVICAAAFRERVAPCAYERLRSVFREMAGRVRTKRRIAALENLCEKGLIDVETLQERVMALSTAERVSKRFGSRREAVGSSRIHRGGSWNNDAHNCRSSQRNRNDAGNRNDNIGFRLFCSAAPQDGTPAVPAENQIGGKSNKEVSPLGVSNAGEKDKDDAVRMRYKFDLRGKNINAKFIRVGRERGFKNEYFAVNKILVYGN